MRPGRAGALGVEGTDTALPAEIGVDEGAADTSTMVEAQLRFGQARAGSVDTVAENEVVGAQVADAQVEGGLADAVAVLYARERLGAEAESVIHSLINARERFSANDPTHNTSKMLNRLVEQDTSRLANESMGVAATRLLSSL